jgi:hypothetical protein
MRSLPEFITIGGVSFEVVLVARVAFRGQTLGCRAMMQVRRLLVSRGLSPAGRRRALARGIRLIRRVHRASRSAAA